MRRKPTAQGGNGGYNQQRKQRYQGGGSNGGDHRSHNHSGNGRPRKNYAAAREKYLSQARDALAAGDRVLAENYFQHADHCYRMMVEEGYQIRNSYTPPVQEEAASDQNGAPSEDAAQGGSEDVMPNVATQLPAFLTTNFESGQPQQPTEPVIVQGWEE